MPSPLPPPRWKRWLLASLALSTLALVWLLLRVPLETPGSTGSTTEASLSRASSNSRGAGKHPGPESPSEGTSPEPTGAGSLELGGLVTDAMGQPLEGVNIVLRANALSELDGPVSSTTGPDGRYQLTSLPPGLYSLYFHRERYLSHHVDEHVLTASGTLDVVLEPALLVEGRVVDEKGQPVPRAHVELRPMELPEDYEVDDSVDQSYSDEAGHFVLDAPSEGPWRLGVSDRDYLYSETKLTAPASGVEVVLKAGAGLEVVVVDEEDQPVADATCTLVPDAPWPNGWETFSLTDEQGRAVISGLMGGRYLLMATPPWKTPFRMAEQRVELRKNERRQVRLRFEQGVELAGVVVDGEGKPVAGAEVRTLPEAILGRGLHKKKSTLQFHYRRLYDEWEGKAGRPALTGPDGRFVLRHLRPETYRLSASKLGYVMDVEAMGEAFAAEGHKGLRVKAGTDKPARLVLSYRGFIRGRVVGSGGQPLTEFELDGQPMRSEDGTFVVGVRQFGPHMLRFIAPGRAVTWRRADMAGRDVELGDVVLEEGGPVRVQVVEAEGGGPVERAQVQVWAEEDGQWFQTGIAEQTGQDGTVRLPAMEPRRLELVVRHSDYRGERMPLAPGQREVTVTLKAGAVLQGWLRTDEGPVRHGKVNLYEPGGRWVATLQATDGWYTQRGIAPGRYVARAWSPSLPEPTVYRPREVDVPEDGVVELDFQSEPRGSVLKVQVSEEVKEVRLVSGRFQPTSLVELRAGLPRGEPWEKDYERHELGRDVFFFRGLAPGRYTLLAWRVRRERLEVHREEVEMSATAERTLELQPRWRDMGHAGENGREMWVVP